MEIKGVNAINSYKANAIEVNAKKKSALTDKAVNRDTTEFSPRASLDGFKSALLKNIDPQASAEKLSALGKSVEDGTYYVSTENILKAITQG